MTSENFIEDFQDGDDPKFVSIVSKLLAKDAHSKRGLTRSDYILLARALWDEHETDQVYAVKLLFDPVVQPEFADESENDPFCVLVARVNSDGELVDAPPEYLRLFSLHTRLSHLTAGSPIGGETPDPSGPVVYLLAFFDVLGFETLLVKLGLNATHDLYQKILTIALQPQSEDVPWSKSFSTLKGQLTPALMWLPIQTAYFSDSILLWVPYHHSHVEEFLNRCSKVFCAALDMGLPLRGAITFGEAIFDKANNIYLGSPLIEAARLEATQNWIGVSLGKSFKQGKVVQIPPVSIMFYNPPMKVGGEKIFSGLVLDWPRTWRETKPNSALERLKAFCTSDLPEDLQKRYHATMDFFKYSEKNADWDLPEGAVRIKP